MKFLVGFLALFFIGLTVATLVAGYFVSKEFQKQADSQSVVKIDSEADNIKETSEKQPMRAIEAFDIFKEETVDLRSIERLQETGGALIVYRFENLAGEYRYIAWGEEVYLVPDTVSLISHGVRNEVGELLWEDVVPGSIVEVTGQPIMLK